MVLPVPGRRIGRTVPTIVRHKVRTPECTAHIHQTGKGYGAMAYCYGTRTSRPKIDADCFVSSRCEMLVITTGIALLLGNPAWLYDGTTASFGYPPTTV